MSAALSEVVPILPYWASGHHLRRLRSLYLYGMQFLTRFQSITAWIYGLGVALVFVALFTGWSREVSAPLAPHPWWSINPGAVPYSWRSVLGAFGAMSGVLGAIMILLSPSTARFARRNESGKVALLMSLFGAVFPLGLAMSFGVYLLAASGGKIPDPGVSLPRLLGPIGLLLVVLTQLRVNVINVYFGTTALENFAAQIFKFKWSRVRLLGPFMICAYLLLLSPFLKYFGTIMTILSVFLVNWVSVIAGELWLVRPRYADSVVGGIPPRLRRILQPDRIDLDVAADGRRGAHGERTTGCGCAGARRTGDRSRCPDTAAAGGRIPAAQSDHPPVFRAGTRARGRAAGGPRLPAVRRDVSSLRFVQCPFHDHSYICSGCCAAEQGCGMMCHTVGQTGS